MNWPNLVADLISSGMTQIEIAHYVGTTQGQVSGLARGLTKSPRWDLGQKYIELHKRCNAKQKKAA